MKICFPVESDKGVESEVYGHFGSAPVFVIADTENNSIETINNNNQHHAHGMCNPLKALDGKSVDAIVVGGIGAGAINKLNAQGVKVFRAFKGTVKTNLTYFENGSMPLLTLDHACGGHGGGCSH